MSAYVIGHIRVRDPEAWEAYRAGVPATLEPWGGEVLFRGAVTGVFSGAHEHEATVVIRFPDEDAVTGWYNSDAYQALLPVREQAADVTLIRYREL